MGQAGMEMDARQGAVVRLKENCFIRATPSTAGAVLGVAKRGETLPCGGPASPGGWRPVLRCGLFGWVSGSFCEERD